MITGRSAISAGWAEEVGDGKYAASEGLSDWQGN
jgi:hypothetical protein